MAAAEARAVWQRTANRYFVQEDAKRAPKLACRPSSSSSSSSLSSKQSETKPANNNITDGNDRFLLPDEKPRYSDFSSESKWWLQLQTDYMYQRGLTNSHQFVDNQDTTSFDSLSKQFFEFVEIKTESKFHPLKGLEKNGELPWWQMAGKDDFDSFISKRSDKCIENRHLPRPNKTGSNPQKLITIQQGPKEKPIREIESSKAKILEALRHSQTRARMAENAAKEAYEEKEHVIKIVLRQASELFACRQWIHLLQLENLYYQIKNSKSNPISAPSKIGKLQKKMKKAKGKRRSRRFGDNLGKYAVVFAMGLGIVGAGLLLGWTVGWMLI